jgi:hypothetical protein
MVDPDNYVVRGDDTIAVPRSILGQPVHGRVLEITGDEVGHREFIIEVQGTNWLTDGAIGLPENRFLFEVRRGDAWVGVPPYLLREEADEKALRSMVNTQKRIEKKAPLFASQIRVEVASPDEMIARVNGNRRETLEREHQAALRATELRTQVQSQVNAQRFAILCEMRNRYPRTALYGIEFWREQLRHADDVAQQQVIVNPPTTNCAANIPWLRPDAEVDWLSPIGPKKVRVLFIGQTKVMVKFVGAAITAYDPREFPYGNTWVPPEQLIPS